MKKTLIITLEYPPTVGGIATYVHDLANALTAERVVVLAPRHPAGKDWDSNVTYKVIRKNMLFPRFIWPRWVRLAWQVFWITRKEKIELLMVHHVLPAGYAAVLMKIFKKIPFLLFSHGTDVIAGAANPWKRRMVNMVAKHAEKIFFNSESLERRFLQIAPDYRWKSLVLYPCPEEDFLVPPPNEETQQLRGRYALNGKKVLLSVGRLADGKGFQHMVRLLPEIVRRVPNLVWVVVGDGPKKQYLVEQIQKNSLQNVVRFIGEVPHGQLRQYYYLADAFCVLTHPDEGREEGLGLVFLEAAAAGLPIVAGRSGGVEEGVLHEQTGLVVDIYKGDQSVIDAIVKVLTDTEYAKTLGDAAKARIKKDFNWPDQVRRLEPWIG